MNVSKKQKLIKFIDNKENRMLVIWFLTIISYCFLLALFDNFFVLLFGYFACFLIYSKLFDYFANKIKNSFSDKY